MKTVVLALVLTLGTPMLRASDPFVALDAIAMSGGTSFQTNWITDYGSYDVTGRANKALAINLSNRERAPLSVTAQWIFTARFPGVSGRWIFDMGEKEFPLAAGQSVKFNVCSVDIARREQNFAALGQRFSQGADLDGWVVLVKVAGKVIKCVGSSSQLEDAAKDEKRLAAMVAEYQKLNAGGGR